MSTVEDLRKLFPETARSRLYEAEAHVVLDVAQMLYDKRIEKGWSQAELGRRAGSTQSGIARQEDPDYGGAKLATLARFFAALGYQMEVTLRPLEPSGKAASKKARRAPRAKSSEKRAAR